MTNNLRQELEQEIELAKMMAADIDKAYKNMQKQHYKHNRTAFIKSGPKSTRATPPRRNYITPTDTEKSP